MENKTRRPSGRWASTVHQTLVVFPLGLLATSVLLDLVYLFTENATAATAAAAMIAAGLVAVVLAVPWGTAEAAQALAKPRDKAVGRALGVLHGGGNLLVMALFLASWWLRHPAPDQAPTLAYALSFGGAGLALVTAWLGEFSGPVRAAVGAVPRPPCPADN